MTESTSTPDAPWPSSPDSVPTDHDPMEEVAAPGGAPRDQATTVQLADIRVDYGQGPVLDDCSIEVHAGEWVALVGPNGAGKSSLLGVLTGLVTHTGSVRLRGDDPSEWRPREWARRVALVPQRPIIPGGLTVTDYVLLGRTAHIPQFGVERGQDLRIVGGTLERLDLFEFADRPVLNLSGGELQRVVLARALVQQAPIMLLDEPTSALDIGHAQHVLELVDQLRVEQDLTIIAAMHDLTLASQYAERIVLLAEGRVVADGPPSEVLTRDIVQEHYDAHIDVRDDGHGGIVVVPVRNRPTSP